MCYNEADQYAGLSTTGPPRMGSYGGISLEHGLFIFGICELHSDKGVRCRVDDGFQVEDKQFADPEDHRLFPVADPLSAREELFERARLQGLELAPRRLGVRFPAASRMELLCVLP